MHRSLTHFAKRLTELASTPVALVAAICIVFSWLVGVPFINNGFGNNTYQLLINTFTTIVTFILGFAILVAGKLFEKAVMAKLDELIESIPKASNTFVGIEDLDDDAIESLRAQLRSRKRKGTKK